MASSQYAHRPPMYNRRLIFTVALNRKDDDEKGKHETRLDVYGPKTRDDVERNCSEHKYL